MTCKHLDGCEFFNDKLPNMPRTTGLFTMRYCKDSFATCARYLVTEASGQFDVPDSLFPNQIGEARSILGVT